ncbi:MAG: phosphoglycerate kinase [Candidatus Poseidoniales archaeon]|nr:MAG: phosphoglycerate kinase [Candidatus Poseidoniales archaeon]
MKNRGLLDITMARVLTLDNVNIDNKTVLVRVDINSPLRPDTKAFLDTTRIKAIVPTLNRLIGAKVVLLAHQSRPGKNDFTSTLGHSRELGRILGRPIKWVDDLAGEKAMNAIESLKVGEILMLNNVRMYDEELNSKGNFHQLSETTIVQNLASVADLFVYDAFACAHRSTATGVGFTHLIPCVAGEVMNNEITKLDLALQNPARPCLAVLGGIKVDDSIAVADHMLRNNICDEFWATGGVANLLLELSGYNIGSVNHDFLVKELGKNWHQTVETAKALIVDFKEKIHLPVDVAANIEDNRVDIEVEKLPIEAPIFDLGIQSIRNLSAAIKNAGTVHLNGPAGVFERPDFAFGTIEMLNACAESKAYVVVGGGHTATLIVKHGLRNKMGHLSTGGGACLDYIAGKILPAVASLETSANAFTLNVQKAVDQ